MRDVRIQRRRAALPSEHRDRIGEVEGFGAVPLDAKLAVPVAATR
jgi:hypothetical protein